MNLERIRKILTTIVGLFGAVLVLNGSGLIHPIPHEVVDWAKDGALIIAVFGKSVFGWVIAPNAQSIVNAAHEKISSAAAVGVTPSLKTQMDAAPGATPTSEMLTPPGGKRS